MNSLAIASAVACAAAAHGQDAFPVVDPAEVGVSAEALDELAGVVADYVDRGLVVGAELLVIKDKRTVLHESFGMRDAAGDVPWGDDTICNIRPMTKPITGAAIQILVDRGLVALDDPVSKHLPQFDTDALREVTIDQLLTHRSGLPLAAITDAIDQYEDLDAMAAGVAEGGPEFEPGSKFWYSDAGTDMLAAVIEAVTGETVDAFVTREILTPLGMDESFYGVDASDPRFDRIGTLYVGAANAWTPFWDPSQGTLYPFAWGSQTIYGTPGDYAKFLAMWMDGGEFRGERVLSEEAVARQLAPISPMSMLGSDERFPTEFDGLEVWYGRMSVLHMPEEDPTGSDPVIIGHSGSDGTIAWAWPERDLIVLYFTQSRGGMTALRIEEDIERLLLREEGEVVVAEPVPAELAPYIGVYIANFGSYESERFEVRMHDGRMALDIPSQMVFDLLEPDGEGMWAFAVAPAQVKVEFVRDDAGAVTMLRLHQGPMVFEVPREGTALAAEQADIVPPDPAIIEAMLGTYRDPESGDTVSVFLEGDRVCIQSDSGAGPLLHLRPTKDPLRWQVRQGPHIHLLFTMSESGEVGSMTRQILGEELVFPRVAKTDEK
jgi:CubicO group peptidase (beta-lactamase class C family)